MGLETHLYHTCSIYRHSHTLTSQQKGTARTLVDEDVPCFIQPLNDIERASILGVGVTGSYLALFDNDVDLLEMDDVVWNGDTYQVKGITKLYGRHGEEARIVEAVLHDGRA